MEHGMNDATKTRGPCELESKLQPITTLVGRDTAGVRILRTRLFGENKSKSILVQSML
jgi:hypothetical protein